MTTGLVTAIVPVRNRPDLLADAVRSVIAQTYRPIEIIVIDDGSTDGTADAARALVAAHPDEVRLIRQEARGVAAARNTGLDAASGEFVQFLDSDDVLMPEKFARQVAGLGAHPECGISYCRTREYRLGGPWSGLPARRTGEALSQLFPELLFGRVWAAPSPLYRRQVLEQNGPMDELAIYEDWDFEARAASRHVRLQYCDEYLADKRDTHHLAGGQKGGTRPHKLRDYAEVHHRLSRHAVAAGVGARDLDRFAGKVAAAARTCAADGCEVEARGLIELARQLARPLRRVRLSFYESVSNQAGWAVVARRVRAVEQMSAMKAARALQRWPAAAYRRWRHRAIEARAATAGRAVAEWPQLLAARWAGRQSRHRMP